MEDNDTDLLARVAANHLFLAQFERFRATPLTLRSRNPDLARAILQTVVAGGGRFDKILWSRSCPSPSLLTYLSTLELLQFNVASSIWSFDPDTLQLRVEFLLYIQTISSRLLESVGKVGNEELKELSGDSVECSRVLDKLSDLGLNRLRPDLIVIDERGNGETSDSDTVLSEEELMCLRRVILENADLFDALSGNIQKQVQCIERDDSGLAINLLGEGKRPQEEDVKVLKLIQRSVQILHLDAMKECLVKNDEEGMMAHVRFLHLVYGVEENEYRMVLQDLLKKVLSRKAEYGDSWFSMRDKLLLIYGEALSSNCTHLVQMIQVLSLFPRLQPLVAAMGWDLLSGKTTARRKLMQLLWTSRSQVLQLEESSLYGNQLDEVSCIEPLCDFLCYQLDLASFVACVNSGQSWSSKSSLLLSRKEPSGYVLFDVVRGIKFQDAIELISMQPITSTVAGWKRMQDIELMHVRYAVEFAVLALGAMEISMTDETGSHHQMAL